MDMTIDKVTMNYTIITNVVSYLLLMNNVSSVDKIYRFTVTMHPRQNMFAV